MHQQTPLGSHPDIEKPRVPQSLQLLKVLIEIAFISVLVYGVLSTETVPNLVYGLPVLGLSLISLIDTIYNWQNRTDRIWNLSFLATSIFLGSYLILKP